MMTRAFLLILTIFSHLLLALGAPTLESIELDKRITHTGRVSLTAIDHYNFDHSPNPFYFCQGTWFHTGESIVDSVTGIYNDNNFV